MVHFGVCDTWLWVKPRPDSPAQDNWNFIKVLLCVCLCVRWVCIYVPLCGCGCVLRVGMGDYESAWVCFSMSNIEERGEKAGTPPAATCSSAPSYKSCSLIVSKTTDTLDSSGCPLSGVTHFSWHSTPGLGTQLDINLEETSEEPWSWNWKHLS